MRKGKKISKGFTLIEILMIVIIITILVSVILVSLIGAKTKSQDNAVFTSFKSVAPAAFMCLTSGNNILTNPISGTSICSDDLAVPNAVWPDFNKKGWSNTVETALSASTGFFWCDINSPESQRPTSVSVYANGSFGGRNITGDFCLMLKRGDKYIWCTDGGCRKEGF